MKILFCGDFFSTHPQDVVFGDKLKDMISECDFRACTFEGGIKGEKSIIKSGAVITQSNDSPAFIQSQGFNVFSLANNHMMDWGLVGCEKTKAALSDSVIFGAGKKDEAYSLKILEKDGLKIGLLGFSHYEFGMSESQMGTDGVAWINDPKVNLLVQESKKEVDYLVLMLHAGIEKINIPLKEWRYRYKELIEQGADLIIGSHPHVPQGMETYLGKRIYYSLGNFFFDRANPKDLRQNISRYVIASFDDKGDISFEDGCLHKNGNTVEVDNSEPVLSIISELDELLSPGRYGKEIDNITLDLWNKTYQRYFYARFRRLSFKYGVKSFLSNLYKLLFKGLDYPLLINNMRCESHRYCISNAMSMLMNRKQL